MEFHIPVFGQGQDAGAGQGEDRVRGHEINPSTLLAKVPLDIARRFGWA